MPSSRTSPIVVASLLALAGLLAGCGAPDAPAVSALRVEGTACTGAHADACVMQGGTLVVRGLRLDGEHGIGVHVAELSTNLVLDGLTIAGYDTGLEIDHSCATCTVTLQDSSITARSITVVVGHAAPVSGNVVLKDVRLGGLRVGTSTSKGGAVFGTDTRGLDIGHYSGTIELRHVEMDAGAPSNGWAIFSTSPDAALVSDGLSIRNFGRGLVGQWKSLTLQGFHIECGYDAIYADTVTNVTLRDAAITGCNWPPPSAECINFCGGAAVFLFGHPEILSAGAVSMDGLVLRNTTWGMSIGPYGKAELRNFRMDNGLNAVTVIANRQDIRNGTVSNYTYQGIDMVADHFEIERVAFKDNGAPGNYSRGGLIVRLHAGYPLPGAPIGSLGGAIHNSSFEGNLGVAINVQDTAPVDATGNWWGSPLGPAPPTPAAVGNPHPPGFGDTVLGPVITSPHRTAPP